jgi:hypothetical protein
MLSRRKAIRSEIACSARSREPPEVMTMPRSMQSELDHADGPAARHSEEFEPSDLGLDASSLRLLRQAVLARAAANRQIIDAVRLAR